MRVLIIFHFLLISGLLYSQTKSDSILNVLNEEISNREIYSAQREDRINDLKVSLSNISDEYEKFSLNDKIYNEYKSYQYDSAYVYALNTIKYAEILKDPELQLIAKSNLQFCFISSGLFKEAVDIAKSTDLSEASSESKANFYSQCARLYSDLFNYNPAEPYKTEYQYKSVQYCDSALMLLNPESYEYNNILALKKFDASIDEKISTYLNLITSFDIDYHSFAIHTSNLGHLYMYKFQEEEAIYYMALSAIADIKTATMENTSKTALARFLYNKGDIKRASRYIQIALEEANFYNARHRILSVNSILPIIEKEHLNSIESQRDELRVSLIWVSILSVLFFFSALVIYKQNKKLKQAKQVIQTQVTELSETNDKLNRTNEKLEESNEIKDQYIIHSLYGKSEYLDKVEGVLKKLDYKLKAHQYNDIYRLHAEFNLKRERENLFLSFDQAFLTLFPNFIEEYNKLFAESDRVTVDEENLSLTPELRIFALIRLGINENERIAKFLNLSMHTIYSYKAKTKNKSIVPKEEFEYRIMQIKKSINKRNTT